MAMPTAREVGMRAMVLLISIFVMGWAHFSWLWVPLVVGLVSYDAYRKQTAQAKRHQFRIHRQAHHKKQLNQLVPDLPNWVQFNTKEKARWLNGTLGKLWPQAKTATEEILVARLGPILDYYRPGFLTKLRFEMLDLGHTAPIITGISIPDHKELARSARSHNAPGVRGEHVPVDLHIKLAGDAHVVLTAGTGPISVDVVLRKLEIVGTFRVELNLLTSEWLPCFRAFSLAFVEKPSIQYQLDAVKLPLSSIPGLSDFIKTLISNTLASLLVLPRKMVWPMTELLDVESHSISNTAAKGIFCLNVQTVVGLNDKYNAYATVTINADEESKQKTHVAPGKSVLWDTAMEWVIGEPSSSDVLIQIKDDCVGVNKVLGRVTLPRVSEFSCVPQRLELPLEGGEGKLTILAAYKTFVSRPSNNGLPEQVEAADRIFCEKDENWSRGVLCVDIFHCKNLPPCSSVAVELVLEQRKSSSVYQGAGSSTSESKAAIDNFDDKTKEYKKKETYALKGTRDPVYWQNYRFQLDSRPISQQHLNVRVVEKSGMGKDKLLASLRLNLARDIYTLGSQGTTRDYTLIDHTKDAGNKSSAAEVSLSDSRSGTVRSSKEEEKEAQKSPTIRMSLALGQVSLVADEERETAEMTEESDAEDAVGSASHKRQDSMVSNASENSKGETDSATESKGIQSKNADSVKHAPLHPLAIAKRSGAVLTVCFLLGRLLATGWLSNWLLWALPFLAMAAIVPYFTFDAFARSRSRWQLIQEQKVAFDRRLYSHTELSGILHKLPLWMHYPDEEKVIFLYRVLRRLWPHMNVALGRVVTSQIQWYLDYYKPAFLDGLKVSQVYMGTAAPLLSSVRNYAGSKQGDCVILDMSLEMATDTIIEVEVTKAGKSIKVRLDDLSVLGTLRVVLRGLVPVFPCFRVMEISFTSMPQVDFNLAVAGLPVMSVPGLASYIQNMLHGILSNMLVWPRVMPFPIVTDEWLKTVRSFKAPAKGILRVHVQRATDLRNVDFMGTSDPFCTVIVADPSNAENPTVSRKTAVVDNNCNPAWNEKFEFIIRDPSLFVSFVVNDYDKVGKNELLGEAQYQVSDLQADTLTFLELPLKYKGKANGTLYLSLEYKPFCEEKEMADVGCVTADEEGWSAGALFTRVQRCHGLAPSGAEEDVLADARVELELGHTKVETHVVENTNHPVFDKDFALLVLDPTVQRLNARVSNAIRLNDLSSLKRTLSSMKATPLGRVSVPLSGLLGTFQIMDTWTLEQTRSGTLDLALNLQLVRRARAGRMDVSEAAQYVKDMEQKAKSTALDAAESTKLKSPKADKKSAASAASAEEELPAPSGPGTLHVIAHKGINLPCADSNGLSDPYLLIEVDGNDKETKVVKKSLNPVWDQSFDFRIKNPMCRIEVTVKDHELIGFDQVLGKFYIDLQDVRGKVKSEFKLEDADRGTVLLTLEFKPDKSKTV